MPKSLITWEVTTSVLRRPQSLLVFTARLQPPLQYMIFISHFSCIGKFWALPLVYVIKAIVFFLTVWMLGERAVGMETSHIFSFFGAAYATFRFNAIYILGYHVAVNVVEHLNNYLFANISPEVISEYQTVALVNTHLACGSAFAFYGLFHRSFTDLAHRLSMHFNVFATAWIISFIQLHSEILHNYQHCRKDPKSCETYTAVQGAINSLAFFWILTAVFQFLHAFCLATLYLLVHWERPFKFIHCYVPFLIGFLNPRVAQYEQPQQRPQPPPRPPPPVRRAAPAG